MKSKYIDPELDVIRFNISRITTQDDLSYIDGGSFDGMGSHETDTEDVDPGILHF